MGFDIQRGGEPPALTRGKGKYLEIAQAARDVPGEWLHIEDMPGSLVVGIKRGEVKGFELSDAGWFEAKSRDVKDKRCTLWVRYNTGKKGEGNDVQ